MQYGEPVGNLLCSSRQHAVVEQRQRARHVARQLAEFIEVARSVFKRTG
jgi:hypothetical protein